MTKEEFIDKWEYLIPEFYHVELAEDLDSVIQQAIAEHEQSKWKKYPENKPEGKTKYIVQYYDNSIDVLLYFGGKFTSYDNHVIAFRELPKPYQEVVGNPFRPTTDSNPKAFKP